MGGSRGLLAPLLLAIALASQIGEPLVDFALLPFAMTLLAAHIDREGCHLARALVRVAARLLPAGVRDDQRDEWLDHVESAGERGLLPLTRALSIALIGAPCLAVGMRVGRSRRYRAKS